MFLGYKNVFKYLENSMAFVLTSEWEDPGFVSIEAASTRTTIISVIVKMDQENFWVMVMVAIYMKKVIQKFWKLWWIL